MTKRESQRKKLFDLYAQNLTNVCEMGKLRLSYPDENGNAGKIVTQPVVYCPLCMKVYHSEALGEDGIDRLTIEHIPPESVGGKAKILTCKLCNDKFGKELDHHLLRQMSIEPFSKGLDNSSIKGKIKVGDNIPLSTILSYENGTLTMKPHFHKSYKEQYYKTVDEIKLFRDGSRFNIMVQGSNQRRYILGLLKSAYLEMFSLFGHIFLFNGSTQKIREQINNPDAWLLPHSSILEMNFDKERAGVYIIYSPKERLSFLVIIDLSVKNFNYAKRVGVLIPGPGKEAWVTYTNYKDGKGFEAKLILLSENNFIKEKELSLWYNEVWKKVKDGNWENIQEEKK